MARAVHGNVNSTQTPLRTTRNSQDVSGATLLGEPENGADRAPLRRDRRPLSRREAAALTTELDDIVAVFGRQTGLGLDECLRVLQPAIAQLGGSSLGPHLAMHGLDWLPDPRADKPDSDTSEARPTGCFHIDVVKVRGAQGKPYLFTAFDRTSRFAYAELHERITSSVAGEFLQGLIRAVPYKVHIVLTDYSTEFTDSSGTHSSVSDSGPAVVCGEQLCADSFRRVCMQNSIDHHLTKQQLMR